MKPILIALLTLLAPAKLIADEIKFEDANRIFAKYCAGCHNNDDANGDFALHDYASLSKGGESGNAITPGSAASSRLAQMMLGKLDPIMPPEDETQPSEVEIQTVIDWIEAGAKGPSGNATLPTKLDTPKIESAAKQKPVTAMAVLKDRRLLATARFQSVTIESADEQNGEPNVTLDELPGKVTSLQFLNDGKQLLVGTGIAGLYGEAILFDLESKEVVRTFRGHSDMVYSVATTKNEKWLATAGYDRKAVLWRIESDQPVREYIGHNDAIFECCFDPTGKLLVTASADATIKIWRVADGMRLDTRGEPLKEQYTTTISGDGQHIFAGGEDNRIRKWKLVSQDPNQTNPLEAARFGHESAIQLLRVHPNDKHLVSVSDDGTIKVWDIESMSEVHQFDRQTESVQAMAISDSQVMIGRMDGTIDRLEWPRQKLKERSTSQTAEVAKVEPFSDVMTEAADREADEAEPNDSVSQANELAIPAKVSGTIFGDDPTDVDHFRFEAKKGQRFVITARGKSKSPVDTQVMVLDADANPVPRILLQAVRDSYFTFRGKNSDQTNDFRIHNWEEMRLNQLLYCNGEVVKLYHYPRGPDSGFNVFPDFGKRNTLFDTTPITHALHEPCYIVEAHPPGTKLPANGLPQFLLNYENDDDAERELGKNARLMFTAPDDGEYIIRVRDSRDFKGEDFHYELTVKPPNPSFKISKLNGEKPTLIRGAFKRLGIEIDRVDGFQGPIEVQLDDLPKGIIANSPITIEAGNLRAFFTLHVTPNAPVPAADAMSTTITATASVNGRQVRQSMSLGTIKIVEDPKLKVELVHAPDQIPHFNQDRLPVFEIRPGETITASVKLERLGHTQRVNFGKENAALNLPFGVYVDNTGLNGVLIPPDKNERTFFLTAESWVKPSERLIFLEAQEAGKPSSNPAILRVLE